jgi:hypothetical protein
MKKVIAISAILSTLTLSAFAGNDKDKTNKGTDSTSTQNVEAKEVATPEIATTPAAAQTNEATITNENEVKAEATDETKKGENK